MMKKNLIGNKYGNLTVIDFAENHPKTHRVCWKCHCDCGKDVIVQANNLQSGNTTSCGCMGSRNFFAQNVAKYHDSRNPYSGPRNKNHNGSEANTNPNYFYQKHGISDRHPLYLKWVGIKKRCNNPSAIGYIHYGGRGIYVCDEWLHDFKAFYDWAYANGYEDGLTIERIDVNGPYSPYNCKWIPASEQANNKTNTIWMTYNGETHNLTQWSKILGINKTTLRVRYKVLGWTVEETLSTPVGGKR